MTVLFRGISICLCTRYRGLDVNLACFFSSPVRMYRRAIAQSGVLAGGGVGMDKMFKFYVKVSYVMAKAL